MHIWEYWELERSFQAKRDQEMTRNIARYGNEFMGQRLAVICGGEHRNYLRRSFLFVDIEGPAVLKECWDYFERA